MIGRTGITGTIIEGDVTPADLAGSTQLLVLQGTPFCNIDCQYCYLANRSDRARMPLKTIAASLEWLVSNGLAGTTISIVWHAGEPLVLPVSWYEDAFARIAEMAGHRRVRHSFQTNAMMINDDWASFFLRHKVNLGVSIDGPAEMHDRFRKTRLGGGTHAAAMKGISILKSRGVPFHCIAVVTAQTLQDPEGFLGFFEEIRPSQLGLNFEETEGENVTSSLDGATRDGLNRFLNAVVDFAATERGVRIREVDRVLGLLRNSGFENGPASQENLPFRIVTVDVSGGIHTFSPELAGFSDRNHDGSPLGNVISDSLDAILKSVRFRAVFSEISTGIDQCRNGCPYFRLCGGGAPANKLAEHGRFDGTETAHCRTTVQAVSEVVLTRVERDLNEDKVADKTSHSLG